MPFYLAIPRNATFSGAVQRGSMTKTDFVRTQPSQLLYQVVSEVSGPLYTTLADNLGTVLRAHAKALFSRHPVQESFEDKFYYAPCTVTELPQFVIPKVQVRFKGQPPSTAMEIIEKQGADVKKLKGATADTYTFRPLDMESLAELMSLEGLDEEFRPTEGAITVSQIEHLALLYTRINMVSVGLRLISPFNKDRLEIITQDDTPLLPPTETTEEMSIEAAPGKAQTRTVVIKNISTALGVQFATCEGSVPRGIITTDSVDDSSGGIYMPFVPEYAEYDISIVSHFFTTFSSIFAETVNGWMDDTPKLFAAWAGGIARTTVGTHLGHMMKSLLMAREGLTAATLIMRADGKYEGSILMGETLAVRHVGGEWVPGQKPEELRRDLKDLNSHNSSVKKILDAAGLVASDSSEFTSIRQLSQAVNASGEPSGMAKNLISKQLPFISFIGSPEKVNVNSLTATLDYLSSDKVIPAELYMDKGSFFPRGRFEEVLCMFGSTVPSLNYGGQDTRRCCDVEGKGVPSELQYHRNTPPGHLQVKQIAIGPACTQWEDMMQHGVIRGNFGRTDKGARELLGEEKMKMWSSLDDFVRKTIIEKGTPGRPQQQAQGGMMKRLREGDIVEDRQKKKNRLFG